MSHELRTPLTGIFGMLDLIQSEHQVAEEVESYLKVLRGSAETLLSLLNDLLDLSKIEAGALKLEQTSFSLQSTIHEVQTLFAPGASKKGLKLTVDMESEAFYVRGDPLRTRQILQNLVSNAIKFTESGSVAIHMTKSALPGKYRVRIHIIDSGTGISKEGLRRLFQPFTQENEGITRKYGGTGLGLNICKQLVQAMGGEIGVESELGKGSHFWFEIDFPKGYAHAIKAEASDSKKVPLAIGQQRNLLVVDDNAVNRLLLKKGLSKSGFLVELADDGTSALQKLKEDTFDLLITDYHMPLMDGGVLVQKMRELDNSNRNIPVIVLTADVVEKKRQTLAQQGIEYVLEKPIQWDPLHQTLKAALKKNKPSDRLG